MPGLAIVGALFTVQVKVPLVAVEPDLSVTLMVMPVNALTAVPTVPVIRPVAEMARPLGAVPRKT